MPLLYEPTIPKSLIISTRGFLYYVVEKRAFFVPKIYRCYKKYASNDTFSKSGQFCTGSILYENNVLFCVIKIDHHNFEKWLIMTEPIIVSACSFLYHLLEEFGKISFQQWCKIERTGFLASFQFLARYTRNAPTLNSRIFSFYYDIILRLSRSQFLGLFEN